MTAPVLSLKGVEKRFGSFRALGPVDLDVGAGERLGIIGPNGSGKTTLINCITGVYRPDSGSVFFEGRDISHLQAHKRARMGIARSFQIPRPFIGMTVFENLLVPLDYCHVEGSKHDRARSVLASVGLSGRISDPSEKLTQLELRKLELARALVGNPKVLIADEAMAGLSEEEIDEVLAILFALNRSGVAVIMIEHIMHAVMRFSERVVCFETGRLIAAGTSSEIAENPLVQKVYFGE
ncbi:ABC transporter ATP-binding protein [Neorhizobium galegae]|uniref:ABC transporter ATP-binding protein n=1 Tax=Neorhizobium galegae TaxID=399 RepID=UPI000622920D|nr:ABC transporter ATP-binding protein [Neorhizobium galegae]CDZ56665.1 High affinity branched-chain amino acid ABC transporter, ATP-binding protein [Neorhizobium galegae bv. orientalis]KAB1122739.1 ABC transporter ATP-binding protein [Neorhizobium galegae]MCQ1807820.1 ABC transporter ATP-binding protein [Neorhizobium galegae]MCQ1838390.1 ABC transporter ATP-binding protein [Neorhizobium galegae]CDZ64244.1 High affinity branched-chain amino acid ABC transporter, ATP-binding protein [Neorhizobi